MILDRLDNARRYAALHPGIAAALDYLQRQPLSSLTDGRHELDGSRLALIVAHDQGRGEAAARLEVHRRYVDLQITIAGQERIGWLPLAQCQQVSEPYVDERDILFFADRPETWLAIPPERFAIFFPDDAHAPLAGTGEVHKAVFKLAVDW